MSGASTSNKIWDFDKEEAARAILAALMLITVLGGALLWSTFISKGSKAVALTIYSPGMFRGTTQDIIIEAVNSTGAVDFTRNDTVKITLKADTTRIRCKYGSNREWCREVTLDLDRGIGRVELFSINSESITLTASWIKGESPLNSYSLTTYILRFRSEVTESGPS